MSDQAPEVSLARQIASVKREIALRTRVYPRQIDMKRMTPAEADREIAAMTAVLHTLMKLETGS